MPIHLDSAPVLVTAGGVASDPSLVPTLALQTDGGTLAGWLALLVGPGLFAALCWSPLLLSGRIRRLFRALPPTGSVAASYLPAAVALSVPFVVGSGYVISTVPAEGAANSTFYLAAWDDDAPETLRERLNRIASTAEQLIATVDR